MTKTARSIIMCDGCSDLIMKGQTYHSVGGLLFCVPCQRSRENDEAYDDILARQKCGFGS